MSLFLLRNTIDECKSSPSMLLASLICFGALSIMWSVNMYIGDVEYWALTTEGKIISNWQLNKFSAISANEIMYWLDHAVGALRVKGLLSRCCRVGVWCAVPGRGARGAAGGGSGSKGPAGAQYTGEWCSTSSAAETAGSVHRSAAIAHHPGQSAAGRALPPTASPR